jgi:hypothetical protein
LAGTRCAGARTQQSASRCDHAFIEQLVELQELDGQGANELGQGKEMTIQE